MIAAGHLFHPTLANGLEWQPGLARLHHDARVVAEAWHDTPTPYDFFHSLRFVIAFPEVSDWWFGDDWPGKVRVYPPDGLLDAGTLYGYLVYTAPYGHQPQGLMWTVTDEAPALIAVPLPPGVAAGSLLLQLAVARQIIAVLQGDVSETMQTVASRVARDELAAWLPTDHRALTADLPRRLTARVDPEDAAGLQTEPRRWALEGLPDLPLRELLCRQAGVAATPAPSVASPALAG